MSNTVEVLKQYFSTQPSLFQPVHYPQGSLLFGGRSPDSCLWVTNGEVKLTLPHPDLNGQATLCNCGPGEFVGEQMLHGYDKGAPSIQAVATSEVDGYLISADSLRSLREQVPELACRLNEALAHHVIKKQNQFLQQAAPSLLASVSDPEVDSIVNNATMAQQNIQDWSDPKLDDIITTLCDLVAEQIDSFAEQTVLETEIGNIDDKIHKLGLVCYDVRDNLLGLKTLGRMPGDPNGGVAEYAAPIGVIFAVVPMTNPIPNSLFKILHSIKTRNALVLSYPRKAVCVGHRLVALVQEVLDSFGVPAALIQHTPLPSSRTQVRLLMSHPGVKLVLATGGSALVEAAHRSGTPTYGVGPGNVPVWICDDADLDNAARDIVASKSYDNGIICGSESNLIVDAQVLPSFRHALEQHGAAVLDSEEKKRAIMCWFDGESSGMRREIIGKPASMLALEADIHRPYLIRVLVIPAEESQLSLLGCEKLAPVLSLFQSEGNGGLALCEQFLAQDGAGHTAVIHTKNPTVIDRFATRVSAGRLLVNTPATFGMMGVSTELPLSFMLGSGSFGGNITTDAITWRHFLNIKRLAPGTRELTSYRPV